MACPLLLSNFEPNHFHVTKCLWVQSSTIDFALCLGATSSDRLATRTKAKNNSNAPLEKKDEVVANVIWRFLELRGCVCLKFSLLLYFHSCVHTYAMSTRNTSSTSAPLFIFVGKPSQPANCDSGSLLMFFFFSCLPVNAFDSTADTHMHLSIGSSSIPIRIHPWRVPCTTPSSWPG